MDEDSVERAATDADKQAQEARSRQYHIASKDGGNVTKPGEWKDVPDSAFADPVNYRYPMKDKAHADNAASRWGDASNRAQYSSAEQKIIGDRIEAAQRTFKENRMTDPVIVREDGNHDPMTGSHSHSHPAFGSQGADETHSHQHSHDNDADHHHSHDDGGRSQQAAVIRADETAVAATMFVPITRIDKDTWEIEGQATSDVIDHYETFFEYDSSKRAFGKWAGNIREMHQPKAVGRAIDWQPDDQNHSVRLSARISKGAPDTWAKICDGTLRGFSIALPAGKFKVKNVERNGKSIPMYYDFDLAEVSVVDSPGSPGCDFQIVRADGMITDVLDGTDETVTPSAPLPAETRAGAALSAANREKLHGLRDSAMQMCADTGCDQCKAMMTATHDDGDGDMDSARAIEAAVARSLAPTVSRVNAMLARIAATPETIDTSAIERRFDAIDAKYAELSEVRALLSAVKEIVERIESQPAAGGPLANGAAMEKVLAGHATAQPQMNDAAAIARAAQLGLITGQEQQAQAAALQIRQMIR